MLYIGMRIGAHFIPAFFGRAGINTPDIMRKSILRHGYDLAGFRRLHFRVLVHVRWHVVPVGRSLGRAGTRCSTCSIDKPKNEKLKLKTFTNCKSEMNTPWNERKAVLINKLIDGHMQCSLLTNPPNYYHYYVDVRYISADCGLRMKHWGHFFNELICHYYSMWRRWRQQSS